MKRSAFLLAISLILANQAAAQVKTWTTTADFATGTFFNTNSTAVSGAITMNPTGTAPLPFINIPVGGREIVDRGWNYIPGQLTRVNTQTGEIVGQYRLTPNDLVSAPSRAVVDRFGNCWVTNNYEGNGVIAVTKIGIIIGGSRYSQPLPGVYVSDPYGEYVKDAVFTTGVDRDGDGYIRTSTGRFGSLLDWNGTAGADLDASIPRGAAGTVAQADDELILVFKRYESSDGQRRSVALDENDDIWVGGTNAGTRCAYQIDGDTGAIIRDITHPDAYTGYNLFYDRGILWGSRPDEGSCRIDTNTGIVTRLTSPDAGRAAVWTPSPDGNMLVTHSQNTGGGPVALLDGTTGAEVMRINTPGSNDTRGITVGQDGDIWVACRGLWSGGEQKVYRFHPDGTLVSSFYTGEFPCGLGVDSDGKIWVTHIGDNYTSKIDPLANAGLGKVVGQVYLPSGSYNYSDGTGATTSVVSRDGEWRGVHDTFRPNLKWGRISWDATVPAMSNLEMFVRAAPDRLTLNGQPWTPVTNGQNLNGGIVGRIVEVRARLSRDLAAPNSVTPELRSVSIRYADGTISGTVGLNNWTPEQFPNADFTLEPAGGGTVTPVDDIELGPFGAFAFTTPLRGTFVLKARSTTWLWQALPTTITNTDNGVAGTAFALINGDCSGNNVIDLEDYLILVQSFDSLFGDANYVAEADLNGDLIVNLDDYLILVQSFDLIGD